MAAPEVRREHLRISQPLAPKITASDGNTLDRELTRVANL